MLVQFVKYALAEISEARFYATVSWQACGPMHLRRYWLASIPKSKKSRKFRKVKWGVSNGML
jgi:hypothetical protein